MNGREIPGFYYDPEKQKYFKIQSSHLVPSGAKYSRSIVSQVKASEQREIKRTADATVRKETLVQRSKVLQHATTAGAGLQREISNSNRLGMRKRGIAEARSAAYALEMELEWERNWVRLTGKDVISTFAYDGVTGDIIVGHDNEHSGHTLSTMAHTERHVYRPILSEGRQRARNPELTGLATLGATRSEVTSVAISPGRVALATTLGGTRPDPTSSHPRGVPAEVHIMMLTGSDDDAMLETGANNGRLECDLRVSFFWHDATDIWTSAANPFVGPESTFAVGMSDKVALYSNGESVWNDTRKMQTQSDAFSLEWLSPTLLSIGQRDGIVKLWDTRSSGRSSAALALQHPGPVSGIKRADSERIVVHGRWPSDGLCMYDLRMPAALKPVKRKRDAKGVRQQRISQPLVVYEHEGNIRPVGFDVSIDSGLVAAVDAKNKVQLYTLHNGQHIKTLREVGQAPDDSFPTRSLQFANTRNGHEELIGCTGGTMWSFRS